MEYDDDLITAILEALEKVEPDHVFASKHLKFKKFKDQNNNDIDVDVRGWVNKATEAQKNNWISKYSDHSLLYFEVQKV